MEEGEETNEQSNESENQNLMGMIGNSTTRRKAMNEFKEMGEEALVTLVNEGMNNDDDEVQRASMDMIGRIKTSKGMPYLILGTQSEDSKVRWHAAKGLRNFNSKKSVNALIEILSDEDKYVRLRAAKSLSNMGEGILLEIEKLIDSEDEMKRMGAARVLEFRNLEVPERKKTVPEKIVEEKEEISEEEVTEPIEEESKEAELDQKTVKELKEMLRDKKMKVSGKKSDLIERLENY